MACAKRVAVWFVLWAAVPAMADTRAPIWVEPPPGAGDCGPIIRDAVARAVAAGPGAEVRLRAGKYIVTSSSDANWFFVIGASDLTVRGELGKTEIIFTDPRKGGFLVTGGARVIIRDLIIDYDPLPFTQGTIVSINAATGEFDLRLDAGYPSPDEPWFATGTPTNQMVVVFDANEKRLKSATPDYFFISEWRRGMPGVWTMRLSEPERSKVSSLAPGDRMAVLSRRGNGAFLFAFTRECILENVTVYASPALTVSLTGSDRMTIRNLAITYRVGSDRLVASDGDGIHCQQNRPLIDNCLFEGLCDDGVNIYAPPLIVRQVLSPTQIMIAAGAEVRAGDTLQVLDPRKGVVRGKPVVAQVTPQDDRRVITFDRPLDGIVAGEDHRSADTAYNLSASGRGYVIRNNHFRRHRRNGLLLRAGDGVVENNTFEELGGPGVSVGNEPNWPEGPAADNIVIRGNRFIGGAYCAGYGDGKSGPGIVICGLSLNGLAQPPLLSDIRIEENRFTGAATPTIWIGSARQITLRNNRSADNDHTPLEAHLEATADVKADSVK